MRIAQLAITTAVANALSAEAIFKDGPPQNLTVQANFTYGSGGTSADAWLQTSLDAGATWIDIANFHFTTASARFVYNLSSLTPVTIEYTPTDGALAANTAKDGLLGAMFRVKSTIVGTYAASTSLNIDIQASQVKPAVALQ